MANDLLRRRQEQMFPKLSDSQLERMGRYGTRTLTRAGEILAELGARPPGLFVVLEGSLEVLAPPAGISDSAPGYELLYLLMPGDFSGEISGLRGTPGLVRLCVREAGAVLLIDPAQLQRIVQADADLSELLMRAFILRRMALIDSGRSEVLLLGSDHSADTLRLREFLTRNASPFVNVDSEHDAEAQALLERFHLRSEDVPVVICRSGALLRNPTNSQLAERLGLNALPADERVHDLLIIGAGPAGLAAAVYAASEGLDVRIVEAFAPGGQAGTSSRIENYLGFPTGISGAALAGRALSQAQKFGAQLSVAWSAVELHCESWPYSVDMADGRSIRSRTILIATGAQYRTPDIPGLPRFLGRGIYYAATHLEAALCADEDAIVVGGGNSAGQAAVFLAGSCRRVHMLVRSDGLAESMSHYLIRRIETTPNISVYTRTQLVALDGSDRLERVSWERRDSAPEMRELRHVFLMTGAQPNTHWLEGCVALDDHGFVKTGPDLREGELADARWSLARPPYLIETSVRAVFAAGDVRAASVKRIASAVGEGSICVQFVHQALREPANAGNLHAIPSPTEEISMTQHTHQTAPTQFVDAAEVRFAYRRFGKTDGVPLVFNMHFTGTMDHWDPLVTDGLAATREVILFNNAGISSSSGEVPTTVEGMAANAAAFIKALGLTQVDLLGFSIGGTVTQALTLAEPQLVRRLVLVGTGPRGGEGMATFTPEAQRIFGASYAEPDLLWQHVHFDATETSQAAGAAFLKRFRLRRENRDPEVNEKVAPAQSEALSKWGAPREKPYEYLNAIQQPTLVINGDHDVIVYTINSYILQQNIPNAQLILYPDASHGALYQYPERFVRHVSMFLSE